MMDQIFRKCNESIDSEAVGSYVNQKGGNDENEKTAGMDGVTT